MVVLVFEKMQELRILVVEDVAADVVMINHELRRGGLEFRSKRVDSRREFLEELKTNPPDLILSDHGLPGFSGFDALAVAHEVCPETPFIFVTSSPGVEAAAEALKSGASDYVLKDRMASQLVNSIRRAMRESDEHRKRREAEQALRESEDQFRLLVTGVKDYALCLLDPQGRVMNWNAGAERMMGYSFQEIIGRYFTTFYVPDDVASGKPERALHTALTEARYEEEGWFLRKSGARFLANVIINSLRDASGRLRGFALVTRDVTEQRQAQEALQKSWTRCRQLVELFPDPLLVQSNNEIIFVNEATARMLGAEGPEQIIGKKMSEIVHADDWESLHEEMRRLREEGTTTFLKRSKKPRHEQKQKSLNHIRLVRLDGSPVSVMSLVAPLTFLEQPAVIVFAYEMSERVKGAR
jgi:PAS domain S-box-containing protein